MPAGPILVASDATADSDAAFPIGQVLATHVGAPVSVISVIRPFASMMYAYDLVPIAMENEGIIRAQHEEALRDQLMRLLPGGTQWPVVLRVGDAAREVVSQAASDSARLIVAGRGRHGVIDRLLAGETIIRLLQLGDTPVLAVEPGLTGLPRRVVIATDFSEYSLYAAQVALTVAAPDATVYLVHVAPRYDESEERIRTYVAEQSDRARAALAEMRALLPHQEMEFHDVLRTGNAVEELLHVVGEVEADLVVTATHGYGFVRRALLGSVATSLVRHAPCAVLCVPGSAHTAARNRRRPTATGALRTLSLDTLDAELTALSERNEARRCTVMVHGSDIGAQVLAHDLPLVGATYDARAHEVVLMFGASQLAGHHLTHTIHGVTEVDVSGGAEGRDDVMRIVHNNGYTLVDFA